MNYARPKITVGLPGQKNKVIEYDILSFDEFRAKRGLLELSNQTIDYNIEKDRLDVTTIGRFRYIVWNDKAQVFNLNYNKAVKTA